MYIYTYTSISRGEYSDKTKTSFTAASDAATTYLLPSQYLIVYCLFKHNVKM